MPTQPNLDDFLRTHNALLRVLELQRAQFGEAHAPAHLLLQIEEIEGEIRRAKAAKEPQAGRALVEAMDPVQRHIDLANGVFAAQVDIKERVSAVRSEVAEVKAEVAEVKAVATVAAEAAAADAALREPRQQETDAHRRSTNDKLDTIRKLLALVQQQAQRANWRSILALIVAVVALVAVVVVGIRL